MERTIAFFCTSPPNKIGMGYLVFLLLQQLHQGNLRRFSCEFDCVVRFAFQQFRGLKHVLPSSAWSK